MKKREAYPFESNPEFTKFWFTSVGDKGEIGKTVEFTPYAGSAWNLAFGDTDAENFNDAAVSDNNDMRKVLQTIANIVHAFFEAYPQRKVYIEPLDMQRKLLYNRLFRQKEEEIEDLFHVYGKLKKENRIEIFDAAELYDAFIIFPRKPIFE